MTPPNFDPTTSPMGIEDAKRSDQWVRVYMSVKINLKNKNRLYSETVFSLVYLAQLVNFWDKILKKVKLMMGSWNT